MTQAEIPDELETAINGVYRGPLEEFVNRRDALVKQLRATKQREAADRVKALRKPSRMAWVLDSVVHEDPGSIEQLAAAIRQAQSGADLRTALDAVKAAVRDVAAVGARVAVRAGQPVEPAAVIAAIQAVIGDASAFSTLRAGLLVDVPEGGGLDMLAALTMVPGAAGTSSPPRVTATPAKVAEKADPRAALAESARAELRGAEKLLAERRDKSEHAATSLLDAKARFEAAQYALAQAQREVEARREDVERTRQLAESAATDLQKAERALADARARLAEFLA